MEESPQKVRILALSCIICGKSLDEGGKAACNPTPPGIQTLINAAQKRKDDWGAMHLNMAFIAAIGKLFSGGGLMDILTSSAVFAVSSAVQMLQGKHYARTVRGLKIAYEAMMHFFLSAADICQ